MYYLLVTTAGLIVAACSLGFTLKSGSHTMIVVGGFTSMFAGVVLFVFGRFYIPSSENLFAITDRDLMLGGFTDIVVGAIIAWGVSSFVAARSKPRARQQQVRINRIDSAYWPQPF